MVSIRVPVPDGWTRSVLEGDPGDVRHPSHVQFGQRLTDVPLPAGLPDDYRQVLAELRGYWSVLLGRVEPPVESPYLSLMEVAVAYYSRALELEALIHEGEIEGSIKKNSAYYRVRTGPLRNFIEAAKKHADLGSRRLTQEELISAQRYDAGG